MLGRIAAFIFSITLGAASAFAGTVTVNIYPSGSKVIAVASGSLTMPANYTLPGVGSFGTISDLTPLSSSFRFAGNNAIYNSFSVSGCSISAFGATAGSFSTSLVGSSASGPLFSYNGSAIYFPAAAKNAGDEVSVDGATMTINKTFALMGLTVGTYSCTWNTNGYSNTLTINVSNSAPASTDANLSAFTISSGTLSPTFASATTSYTASVSNATTSVTVTPTRNQANATITVNGTAVTSGSASGAISLNVGSNTITTVVTAQDGTTTKTYTTTVNREATPTLTFTTPTSASVTMGSSLTNAATSNYSGGSYGTISYASSTTGVATVNSSGVITPVSAGTTTITATQAAVAGVNAQATQTYTLTVNTATSTDANLSAFTISSGTLSPTFASATTSYTASVSNATTSVTVTPTRNQANATITVNGTAVTSGSASGAISLNVGSNTITTVVTAQDGTTTKTYTTTVTREALLSQASFTVSASSTSLFTSRTATLSTAGGSGTGSVTYVVTTGSCAISGTTLTASSSAGSCVVTATKAGDATYSAASATVTITVTAAATRATIDQAATDSSVRATAVAQATAAQRFTGAQIQNLASHIEVLRSNFRVTTSGLTLGVNQGVAKDWMPILDKLKEHYLAQANDSRKQEHFIASPQNAMYLPDLNGEGNANSYDIADNRQNTTISQSYVRHIFLRNRDDLTDQDAEQLLAKYRNQIRTKSANFGGLAEKFSEAQDGSVSQAGMLGWVSPGDLNSEFEQAMNQLKIGEVSSPVKTDAGWHLIQVLERRQSAVAVQKRSKLDNLIKVSDTGSTQTQGTLTDEGLVKNSPNTYGMNDLFNTVYRGIAKDEEENTPTYALWSLGNFDFGTIGGNNGASPTKFSATGVTVGLDYQLHKSIIVGVAFGLGFDKTNMDTVGSHIDSIQKTISTYGIYQPYKNLFLDGSIGYGSAYFNGARIVTYDASNTSLGMSRTGNTLFTSLGVGYQFKSGNLQYQPFVRTTVTQLNLNSYSESGPTNYALAYGATTSVSTTTSAGVQGMYDIFVENGKWTPAAKLMVSNNSSGSINQSAYYADTGTGGGTYYLSSISLPTYTESIGFSLKYAHKRNVSLELGYLGTIGNNSYRANSIRLDARLMF